MIYLTKHANQAAYDAVKDNLATPQVALIADSMSVDYKPYVAPISVTGVSLNKNTLELNTEATETLVATVVPNDADDKSVTWSTSNSNIATVDSNGVVSGVASGSCVITVTTTDGGYTAQCNTTITSPTPPTPTGHSYVEIGGIKWATMNVGAESITDYGLYFQWGDTQGYTAAQVGTGSGQKAFSWADYKYTNDGGSTMSKYNSTDGKTVLDTEDDAVAAAWGGNWRMPTTQEIQSLSAATTSAWTTNYENSNVAGLVLTSTADTNVKLFFPACGNASNGSVDSVGSYGGYWSSSLLSGYVLRAYGLYFNSSSVYWQYNDNRYYGRAVRGVLGA